MDLKRILLVEDDPRDVELTLTALAEHHLANEVVVAHDGEEALHFLRRSGPFRLRTPGNPAVVLMDLKLPKLSGVEVLERLREDPQLRAIPVVMLTSSREETDIHRSYDRGANAYVVKPVHFGEFVESIKELGLFWAVINQPPPGSGNGSPAGEA
jgi:CheY-like chemotaxis protein